MEEAASWNRVSSNYMNVIGQQIVRGRNFQSSDAGGRPRAIINQAFANRFFKDEDPLGKHFGMDTAKVASTFEIVGVARDAKYNNPAEPANPMFYVPLETTEKYDDALLQMMTDRSHFMQNIQLLTAGGTPNLEPQVRKAIAEIDPTMTIISVKTMKEQVASNFDQQRMVAKLAGTFGFIALLLAAIGLYGLTAYSVVRRTAEIGVRMALGATTGDVGRLILLQGLKPAAIGIVCGLLAAAFATRLVKDLLFGVVPLDPLTFAVVPPALLGVAALACIVPAWRAMRLNPTTALRTE
jgi:predicted permease